MARSTLSSWKLMRLSFRLLCLVPLAALVLLASCTTMAPPSAGEYHVTAHKPHDPSKVRVLVSLSKQNVYVMEGDRCLMAVATSVAGTRASNAQSAHSVRQTAILGQLQ